MGEVSHPQVRESGVGLVTAGRTAGPNCLLVEDVRDLGIDVIVEEFVDEFDHRLLGLDLLRGGLGFSVVRVSVLPPLKRTWILVVPSAGSFTSATSSMM